jgi:antitoxin PrlF
METKIVKVTDKGQISIPIDFRSSVGISTGDELIVIRNGKTILIKKVKEYDFSDLLKHSEKVADKLWDNEEDAIWDTV